VYTAGNIVTGVYPKACIERNQPWTRLSWRVITTWYVAVVVWRRFVPASAYFLLLSQNEKVKMLTTEDLAHGLFQYTIWILEIFLNGPVGIIVVFLDAYSV
jgi:hypothetical protein